MANLVRWGLTDIIALAGYTLDSSGDKAGARLLFPRARAPLSVVLYVGSITGTSPVYRVRIETDDGTGLPSGTLYDSNATQTFQPTSTGYTTVTFTGTLAAFSADTIYHLVVEYSSGTINSSNKISLREITGNPLSDAAFFTMEENTGSGWSAPTATDQLCCAITYTNGEIQANSPHNYDFVDVWGTTRYGMRFSLPTPLTVTAFGARVKKTGSPSNLVVKILDSDGNTEESVTILAGLISTSSTKYEFYLNAPLTLNARQTYRMVAHTALENEASSANMYQLSAVHFNEDDHSFDGDDTELTTATSDTGTWTETDSDDVVMWLVLESVTTGATLNTVADVLAEGNWQADAWSPRIADDDAFQAWVAGVLTRANNYVQWIVGEAYYDAQAGSVNESIFQEAEMQRAQYLLCMSAAKVADTSDHDDTGPWLLEGKALRALAQEHQDRVNELLQPYDTRKGRPGRTGPVFRGVTTTTPHIERFHPNEGIDDDPYDGG